MYTRKIVLFFLLFVLSSQDCFQNCKECTENSKDEQCLSCKEGFNMVLDTQNCVDKSEYPQHFIFKGILCPCSELSEICYECDPYLLNVNTGVCLSCAPGYKYNALINNCEACSSNEYPVAIESFDSCRYHSSKNCDLYTTICHTFEEEENICKKNGYSNTCLISTSNYRILFINWLNDISDFMNYPSYNNDKSNYLLIELTLGSDTQSTKRKFYFYNDEGRGFFDEINDIYESYAISRRAYKRAFSSSIVLKVKNSEKYGYLLNFENFHNNLEIIDIKTGEIYLDSFFNLLWIFDYGFLDSPKTPSTQILELNEGNQFLIATFAKNRANNEIIIYYYTFILENLEEQKINIESLFYIDGKSINFSNITFNIKARFFFIQTKSGNLYLSFVDNANKLYYYDIHNDIYYYIYTLSNGFSFQKLLLIKDEIKFISYYSSIKNLVFSIFNTTYYDKNELILDSKIYKRLPYQDSTDSTDILFLTEVKAVFVFEQNNRTTILILDFFDNYKNYVLFEFVINIYGNEIKNTRVYSLIFKYRNMLGLQFQNEHENGFILLGYYNSTDPKQILNIKKDGLNYKINLGNYLNLQSNIFEYEIKCIRILKIPSLNESGIYLYSNITKNFIKENDCIDINTQITLYFSYNGTIKQNNYLFKFVGVLQEPKFKVLENNSFQSYWNLKNETLKEKYIEEYNERRNMNITGRVAIVQINVLNDTKVFCDEKYDEYALKTEDGELIACGEGFFYDVQNVNEITQLNLGMNYYFVNSTNSYIKCHEKCKTCSREFNSTNMNCDLCQENYFLRDDNCYEITDCEYNYYYDNNLNLKCVNRDSFCPDFKPFENIISKECIQNCSFDELNKTCSPTNNKISIIDTYKKIFNNIEKLNLEERLFRDREKYTIIGNNVSFIFTTSDIEKEELYDNYNSSSIILGESEQYIQQIYSPFDELPFPILKIEIKNNHSTEIEVSYELFNPFNLSQKLDLNLIPENYIEIRIPAILKSYKMDLIFKTKEKGYNIFDLNDSFYHDICSPFSYNNSDFSLSERKNIIDLSDENLHLLGCNYSNYDIITFRAIFKCKIGFSEDNLNKSDITNNDNKDNSQLVNLIKDNIDFSKSSNIKVVKCFSIVFQKNLFKENYGFYIMFSLFILNIITFICSPISSIEKTFQGYCDQILVKMREIYLYNENNKNSINKNIDKENNIVNEDVKNNYGSSSNFSNYKNLNIKDNINIIKPIELITDNKKTNKFNKFKKSLHKNNKFNNVRISNLITLNNSRNEDISEMRLKNIKSNNSDNDLIKDEKDSKDEEKLINSLKEKKDPDYYIYYVIKYIEPEKRKTYLSEYEMEGLSYENAIQIEDRNKANYYFALLKEKNKIISIFLNDEDYNIQTIKLSTFIFDFSLALTVNALFYNDEAIYQINQEEGEYSLTTQYSRVIYSALISGFLNFVLEQLALTKKDILALRYFKDINKVESEIPKLITKLKFKCIIYYVTTIFLNIICSYYITAFCSIYTIIQTHMISDSAFSFLLTMSYTLILSLISSIIRIFSLKKNNKFRHCLFFISWIVSLV